MPKGDRHPVELNTTLCRDVSIHILKYADLLWKFSKDAKEVKEFKRKVLNDENLKDHYYTRFNTMEQLIDKLKIRKSNLI